MLLLGVLLLGGPRLVDTTFFKQAKELHKQGNSVISRIDCYTVGPVSTASGYGSSMLTNSAVHVLDNCNETKNCIESDFQELSQTEVGVPKTSFSGTPPTSGITYN